MDAYSGQEITQLPAQIDSAADRTVLPGNCVQDLGLLPLDELPVGSFGGQVLLLATYRVEVGIQGLAPMIIEAIAHPEEPFVLLGRDVLNQFLLVLNGPQLFLELGS
jgi:hypothetical protein